MKTSIFYFSAEWFVGAVAAESIKHKHMLKGMALFVSAIKVICHTKGNKNENYYR